MIQRKQTLFLLELVFLGIAFLLVPTNIIVKSTGNINVYLLPGNNFESTTWHYLMMSANFIGLLFSIVSIFLYKKRTLQLKFSYTIMLLYAMLSLMMAFCPAVHLSGDIIEIQNHYFGMVIGLFAVPAAYLAARFIKKDIELLKSADRIR